jgi:hypothetical protein
MFDSVAEVDFEVEKELATPSTSAWETHDTFHIGDLETLWVDTHNARRIASKKGQDVPARSGAETDC